MTAEVWSTSGMLSPGAWDVVDGDHAQADLQFSL